MHATHLSVLLASHLYLGHHDRIFYYPTLLINTLFVYWIGFIGYSKSNLLFFKPLEKGQSTSENTVIEEILSEAMDHKKLYKNAKLTSQQMATETNLSTTELTKYINGRYGMNFSQYLNRYRTEEAIRLMTSNFLDRFSLEALGQEAGFNSKSSFYQVFKEQTGKTPTAYLKSLSK